MDPKEYKYVTPYRPLFEGSLSNIANKISDTVGKIADRISSVDSEYKEKNTDYTGEMLPKKAKGEGKITKKIYTIESTIERGTQDGIRRKERWLWGAEVNVIKAKGLGIKLTFRDKGHVSWKIPGDGIVNFFARPLNVYESNFTDIEPLTPNEKILFVEDEVSWIENEDIVEKLNTTWVSLLNEKKEIMYGISGVDWESILEKIENTDNQDVEKLQEILSEVSKNFSAFVDSVTNKDIQPRDKVKQLSDVFSKLNNEIEPLLKKISSDNITKEIQLYLHELEQSAIIILVSNITISNKAEIKLYLEVIQKIFNSCAAGNTISKNDIPRYKEYIQDFKDSYQDAAKVQNGIIDKSKTEISDAKLIADMKKRIKELEEDIKDEDSFFKKNRPEYVYGTKVAVNNINDIPKNTSQKDWIKRIGKKVDPFEALKKQGISSDDWMYYRFREVAGRESEAILMPKEDYDWLIRTYGNQEDNFEEAGLTDIELRKLKSFIAQKKNLGTKTDIYLKDHKSLLTYAKKQLEKSDGIKQISQTSGEIEDVDTSRTNPKMYRGEYIEDSKLNTTEYARSSKDKYEFFIPFRVILKLADKLDKDAEKMS